MNRQIIGTWSGPSQTGHVVRYDFRADQTVVWTVESPDSTGDVVARFSLNTATDPLEIDIFDFESPQLKGFRFLGICRYEADDVVRLYGEPRQASDATPRPNRFSDEAIVLKRMRF